MDSLMLSKGVYLQILDTIGKHPPECGGVLGAREGEVVTEFYFDECGNSSANGYVPNVQMINEMLIHDWMPRGILMVGIVHSHSNGISVPSCGDVNYGIRILQALDTVNEFYLPIVTLNDERIDLSCFAICKNDGNGFTCKRIPHVIC